jgi:protein-tyrosine phosphatase
VRAGVLKLRCTGTFSIIDKCYQLLATMTCRSSAVLVLACAHCVFGKSDAAHILAAYLHLAYHCSLTHPHCAP